MFRRLRVLLTLICTGATALVLALMAFSALRIPERQLLERAEESFASNLASVLGYLRGRSVVDQTWLIETEGADSLLIHIEADGRPLLHYGADRPERTRLAALAVETARADYGFEAGVSSPGSLQAEWVSFQLNHDGALYHAAVCSVPMRDGWVGMAVLKSAAPEMAQLDALRRTFVAYVAAAALALLVFSWFFTAWAVRPVEENQKKQNEFVSAASHELRAPLAVIAASAGAIAQADPAQARRFAANIEAECERLSALTGDLLSLARAQQGSWSVNPVQTEPETLLLTVVERHEPVAAQKGVRLRAALPDRALPSVRCDPLRVEQLLVILLDNALRHTPAGGVVRVEARRERRWLCVEVADGGPGIPDEQKRRVFERFWRGDGARTDREHYGLGLSIAREIAALHRGGLSVGDAPEGGAVFVLRLPI